MSMQDREISPEGEEFQPGRRLAETLNLVPSWNSYPQGEHGLAHDGFFFSHL